MDRRPGPRGRAGASLLSLALLGGFALRLDERVLSLPMRTKRLVVFLALHQHPLARPYISQSLWGDATETHADGNLRSALWQVARVNPSIIDMSSGHLELGSQVAVDYRKSKALAHALIRAPHSLIDSELDEGKLLEDLLPDWYEEWVEGYVFSDPSRGHRFIFVDQAAEDIDPANARRVG